ncbi:InlB B-repeat-containing protein [Dielma fastidiosa]|uniref:InlB B-repeat-containing protein n=1 Tax=Dielma fastidiosa TaxID=1034346 RepID=UPI00356249C0
MKSNKTKSAMTALVVAAMLCSAAMPVRAAEAQWVNNNGTWSYVKEDGSKAKGWIKDNDCWYAFDDNGAMRTGWIASNEHWYFMGESGVMQADAWVEDNGARYYIKGTGVMAKDYVKDGYELTEDGKAIPLAESKSVVLTDPEAIEGEVIEGNLYVDVTTAKALELKGVTVKGKLVVIGDNQTAGKLTITDSKIEAISTQTRNTEVVLSGETEVKTIVLEETAAVTPDKNFKGEVEKIEVQSTTKGEIVIEVPAQEVSTRTYASVDIQAPVESLEVKTDTQIKVNADVKNVVVTESAKDTKVEVSKGSTVGTITADAPVKIEGSGTINKVEANVDGVEAGKDTVIKDVETGKDVEQAPEVNKPSTGGGSSSGGSGTTYYTITFDGEGSTASSQSIAYGSKITKPSNPTNGGKVFAGWFNGDTRWDFAKDTVKGSMTLTAKWAESALTVENELEKAEKVNNQIAYLNNVFFADGKNVTVWENDNIDGKQLLVQAGENIYTFDNSTNQLIIFGGSKKTNSNTVSVASSTITIESGYVEQIYGGGYESDVTGMSIINVKEGAEVDTVIGGGTIAQSHGTTAKAQSDSVELNIDGTVRLVYAGGYAPVGPSLKDIVNMEQKTANCFVKEAKVNIMKNANVNYYFGGSYSYGGIDEVNCDVYGKLSANSGYSAIAGTNGYIGKASMNVHAGAEVGQLYSSMRGYITGNIELENSGTINILSLNPDGKVVLTEGELNVVNHGTINNAYFDCGCEKAGISGVENKTSYFDKITVDSDNELSISIAFWESNKTAVFKLPTNQTIVLKGGAKLVDDESLDAMGANKKVESSVDSDNITTIKVVDNDVQSTNVILNNELMNNDSVIDESQTNKSEEVEVPEIIETTDVDQTDESITPLIPEVVAE